MILVLDMAPTPPSSLQPFVLASNVQDGGLVTGISGAQAAEVALTNPGALISYVNGDLLTAFQGLPEGQRVELVIGGWSEPLVGGVASSVASQVNTAWAEGRIDYGGAPIQAWQEYPSQVAWGQGDTLTIRAVVGDPLILLYIFIGCLVVAAIWVLWDNWTSKGTGWTASAYNAVTGGNGGTPGSKPNIVGFVVANLWWELPAAGAVAVTPWLYGRYVKTREEQIELQRAERGEWT